VKECFKLLKTFPKEDIIDELCEILRDHPYDLFRQWKECVFETTGKNRNIWIQIGLQLNVLGELDVKEGLEILKSKEGNFRYIVNIFTISSRFDILDYDFEIKKRIFDLILKGQLFTSPNRGNKYNNSFNALWTILDYNVINDMLIQNPEVDYLEYRENQHYFFLNESERENIFQFERKDEIDEKIYSFIKEIEKDLSQHEKNPVNLWKKVVDVGCKIFGSQDCFYIISSIIAGNTNEKILEISDINDEKISLHLRVRYGRLKSGNISYWKNIINNNPSRLELLVFFSWATSRTISKLKEEVDQMIKTQSKETINDLIISLRYSSLGAKFSSVESCKWFKDTSDFKFSNKFLNILSQRMNFDVRQKFGLDCLRGRYDIPHSIANSLLEVLLVKLIQTSDIAILEEVKCHYQKFSKGYILFNYGTTKELIEATLKEPLAEQILNHPGLYPRILFGIAQKVFKIKLAKSVEPAGLLAKEEKWWNYY